jgi:hypothetical protein
MRGSVHKVAILMVVLVLGLGFVFVWPHSTPAAVQAAPELPIQNLLLQELLQQPDNSMCLGCHGSADQVMELPNGDTISITVDPQSYEHGAHMNLACQVCHTNITDYPHPVNPANSAREYTLQYADSCRQCHPGVAQDVKDSAHHQMAEEGNPNTPICADCHNPHATAPIAKDPNGDPAATENANIANICAKCHSAIVDQYKGSVHGASVFESNNPDVPACHDCHGIHNIATARTLEFRLNSPQLCAKCHTDETIMGKYGISTDVLDTYVSDFHGTTVTLFDKTSPEHALNKPVCYDCHGIHNIMAVDNPQKGLQVQENMLAVCQRCHPDASENFSASWMSHYIPHPQKTPLVYYVQLFYNIFIPGVLGGMGVFVIADIYGKFRNRGKRHSAPSGGKE